MRIIQVCPYDLSMPGGVQTHILQLSKHLTKLGHEVSIIAPSLNKYGLERKFEQEIIEFSKPVRLKLWGTSIDWTYLNTKQKNTFKEYLSNEKPEVIHFHTVWNPVLQTQLLRSIASASGIKKVATFHDTPPDRGLGKLIGAKLMKLATRYYFPKLDEIISVSVSQAKAMGISESNKIPNFHLIPNGIELIKENTLRKKNEPDILKLLFIGRFEDRKGVMELLKICRDLGKEDLNNQFELRLIGDGPLHGSLRSFVEENGMENVHFEGQVDEVKKQSLLTESDLLVAPALYGESFGIILLEAMASGTPVCGYGNAGYLNVVRDYDLKQFPKPGDREALKNVIKSHLNENVHIEMLMQKGFEIALSHDWALVSKEIEKVYQK